VSFTTWKTQKGRRSALIDEPLAQPLHLVRQGKLVYENLMKIGKSEPWVREMLSQLQIYDLRDVRYALLDQFGRVHILYA
jgi:uncharacterized membrane protein YcaP (DUF421 family)